MPVITGGGEDTHTQKSQKKKQTNTSPIGSGRRRAREEGEKGEKEERLQIKGSVVKNIKPATSLTCSAQKKGQWAWAQGKGWQWNGCLGHSQPVQQSILTNHL